MVVQCGGGPRQRRGVLLKVPRTRNRGDVGADRIVMADSATAAANMSLCVVDSIIVNKSQDETRERVPSVQSTTAANASVMIQAVSARTRMVERASFHSRVCNSLAIMKTMCTT